MKRRLAAVAAALGAACFALVGLAPNARADNPPLTIYQSGGIGQGVVATFAVKPSIFNPLLQGGLMYTSTLMTSSAGGEGRSLASPIFPGNFLIGGAKGQIGCGGLPGSPWIEGNYPETSSCKSTQEFQGYKAAPLTFGTDQGHPEADAVPNVLLDRTTLDAAHSRATATATTNESLIQITGYELRQEPSGPALLHIDQMQIENTIERSLRTVTHSSRVTGQGVSILGGAITIDKFISQATTSADGTTPDAHASMTFGDVGVTVGDKTYRASLTDEGVRVTDPALSPGQRASIDEEIHEGMARAGIRVSVGTPTMIVDGQQAEASEEGLTISMSSQAPSAAIPSQVAPVFSAVIKNIPTKCAYELGVDQTLCTGAGVLPGFGSQFPLQLQIGSTNSFSLGGYYEAGTTVGCTACAPGLTPPGPTVLGNRFTNTPGQSGSGQAVIAQPPVGTAPVGQRTGLVSILPSTALAVLGALFLLLAAALALGPSLRHARAG